MVSWNPWGIEDPNVPSFRSCAARRGSGRLRIRHGAVGLCLNPKAPLRHLFTQMRNDLHA